MDNQLQKDLKRRAHALKPVVRVGQHGVTDAVLAELDGALAHHELVKIKLAGESADARGSQLEALCRGTASEAIQQIGHTATLWRKKPATRERPKARKKIAGRPATPGRQTARHPREDARRGPSGRYGKQRPGTRR